MLLLLPLASPGTSSSQLAPRTDGLSTLQRRHQNLLDSAKPRVLAVWLQVLRGKAPILLYY
jgi:hypothetical protein